MFRKITISFIILTVLMLSACSSEKRSHKEMMTDGFQSILDAESFDSTSTVDLNIEADVQDPFISGYLEAINSMEINIDQHFDVKKALYESIIHYKAQMNFMSFDSSIPILIDHKHEKVLLDSKNILQYLSIGVPQEIEGKLIEINLSQLDRDLKSDDLRNLSQNTKTGIINILKNKEEEDFRYEDGAYVTSFSKEELKGLTSNVLEAVEGILSKKQVKGIKEALGQLNIHTFDIHTKIDGDRVKSHKFVIDLEHEFEGVLVKLKLNIHTTYNSINEDVEFNINPSKEMVNIDEVQSILQSHIK